MELGNIPKIDQFKDNKAVEMQQVKSTSNLAKTDEQKELKEIQNESTSKSKYEVTLSNTNFGFNNSSQDFFVRVERGTAENQYPTEDMMRVKAQMRALQKADSES